ncbi:hypothetical protein PHMEG_00018753 [Phytophthora megakarya]|uniref:Uncharacterized protein n=1 Tax=Phytophthora megakarya TaxID=4795 RepID=A0A225VTA6_9STRA|nr:hypothetical protein PHMEG_00018753 [Phytophthora megakarya]
MESAGARKTAHRPATDAGSVTSGSDLSCHQTISSDEKSVTLRKILQVQPAPRPKRADQHLPTIQIAQELMGLQKAKSERLRHLLASENSTRATSSKLIWGTTCKLRTSFRKRTNNKAAQRNIRIAATKSKQPKVPEDWVNYAKDLRLHAHGEIQGVRERQAEAAAVNDDQLQCPDQCVCPGSRVYQSSCVQVANHFVLVRTQPSTFNNCPHIKTAYEPDVADNLTFLAKAGAKKKRIIQFIRENSKCKPIAHDIHNFMLRLTKRGHTAPTSAK